MAEAAEAAAMAVNPLTFDDFLPPETAEQLYSYVNKLEWTHGWRSNKSMGYSHWNNDIAKAGPHNGLDVSYKIQGPILDAWKFIQSTYMQDHILIRCYANAHTHGVEGYPHADSRRDQDKTVVIYMNKDWRREWGGETVVYNGDQIVSASVPKFNRAVIFNGNQWHCARGVTRICPDLRRTIMFKCAKINADPVRDNLQIFLNTLGADKKQHKAGSLMAHLLNTYDLLKAANQTEKICLAGGLHSVFGTNAFKDACISFSERHRIELPYGKEIADIVNLFCTIDRPHVLEKAITTPTDVLDLTDGGVVEVTQDQLSALYAIEAANLYDQQVLSRSPNLNNHWSKIFKL